MERHWRLNGARLALQILLLELQGHLVEHLLRGWAVLG